MINNRNAMLRIGGGGGTTNQNQPVGIPTPVQGAPIDMQSLLTKQYQTLTDRLNALDQFNTQFAPVARGQLNDFSQRAYGQSPADFWKADASFTQGVMGQRQAANQDVSSAVEAIQRYQDSQDSKAQANADRADTKTYRQQTLNQSATQSHKEIINKRLEAMDAAGATAKDKAHYVWKYLSNLQKTAKAEGVDMNSLWSIYQGENANQNATNTGNEF